MDKQEVVRCSKCNGTGQYSPSDRGSDGFEPCPACVPVEPAQPQKLQLEEMENCPTWILDSWPPQMERVKPLPAQPELPRELPLVVIPCNCPQLEQALKRIAELEAELEELDGIDIHVRVAELDSENASLKEQLAVNWLDAPTQAGMYWMSPFCDGGYRYPHMKEVIDFDRPGRGLEVVESLSDCVPIDLYLREYYPKSKWLYLKAPGCPVPAKEEAQNP